jgi:hypothetical protein
VIALPRIRPDAVRMEFVRAAPTVDIALALIRLRDEEVRDVTADMIFVAYSIAAEYLLEAVLSVKFLKPKFQTD